MSELSVATGRRLLGRRSRSGDAPRRSLQRTAVRFSTGSRQTRWHALMIFTADACAGLIALALCLGPLAPAMPVRAGLGSALAVVTYLALTAVRGGYSRSTLAERGALTAVMGTVVYTLAALGLASGLAELDLHPLTLLVVLPMLVGTGLCVRFYAQHRIRSGHRTGVGVQRVLAIGDAASVNTLVSQFSRDTNHALVVVGACLDGEERPEADIPVMGQLPVDPPDADPFRASAEVDAVLAAVEQSGADVVCIAGRLTLQPNHLRALRWALAERNVTVMTSAGLQEVAPNRVKLEVAGGATLLRVDPARQSGPRAWAKGALDRSVAAVLLLVLSPVLLGIAAAIKLADRGPVFYTQARMGIARSPFTMVKFRTMVSGAHAMREALEEQNEHADGVLFKMTKDPRVTRVGHLLRRSSLDELPQLFNVLRGEMSLVGPRPALPEEVARYHAPAGRRLAVKPGMTGLWQVSGRSSLSWSESIRLDLYYVDNWSLSMDTHLLARTVGAVSRGTGAH